MSAHADDPCPRRTLTNKEMSATQAGLDTHELQILEISRYFFISFSEPASQAWMAALSASIALPQGDGGAFLRILDMVQSMRIARKSCFQFNSPKCPCCRDVLSEHERQLIGTLVAAREQRPGAARAHAMMLCEGNDTTPFVAAAERLAAMLPPLDSRAPKRTLRPHGERQTVEDGTERSPQRADLAADKASRR